MARPKKQTVDYFPHSCTHKKTMFIIEQKYGNDGYAFWFKLLEMLGSTEGHFLSLKDDMEWEFLIAKTHLDKDKCMEILNLLAKLKAIDKGLWIKNKVVWSDNFVENVKEAYRNRTKDIPVKPSFLRKKSTSKGINDVKKPHTKLKETKLKETKEDNSSDLKSKSEQKVNINFNFSKKKWENITDEDYKIWEEAYPACDIEGELKKMIDWILSAGAKGHKKNWRRFITNWLSKTQDRGGSKTGSKINWDKFLKGE